MLEIHFSYVEIFQFCMAAACRPKWKCHCLLARKAIAPIWNDYYYWCELWLAVVIYRNKSAKILDCCKNKHRTSTIFVVIIKWGNNLFRTHQKKTTGSLSTIKSTRKKPIRNRRAIGIFCTISWFSFFHINFNFSSIINLYIHLLRILSNVGLPFYVN